MQHSPFDFIHKKCVLRVYFFAFYTAFAEKNIVGCRKIVIDEQSRTEET